MHRSHRRLRRSRSGGSGPGMSAFVWGQRLRIQAGTSQVEDVYASRVVIGAGSRAGRIFAERVELGSGCDVERGHLRG